MLAKIDLRKYRLDSLVLNFILHASCIHFSKPRALAEIAQLRGCARAVARAGRRAGRSARLRAPERGLPHALFLLLAEPLNKTAGS